MEKETLLGDYEVPKVRFAGLDALFAKFGETEFRGFSEKKKRDRLNETLYQLIEETKSPCFLLPAVLAFVERVEREGFLSRYTFASFELWLNQYSKVTPEKNYEIRGKIAGKWIERSGYQTLFPIGMGKVYEGTHIVTAHRSPDLDTTVASFWGWLDAFAARVGDALHLWNVPGGPPSSQIEIDWLFKEIFGEALFTHLAKNRSVLNLTARDLMRSDELTLVSPEDSIVAIDHGKGDCAVVVVDDGGHYLGDWRDADIEGVNQLVIHLSSCIRWFEHQLSLKWISLFARHGIALSQVEAEIQGFFAQKVADTEPVSTFTPKQKERLKRFFAKVLGIEGGLEISFEDLLGGLSRVARVESPLLQSKGVIEALRLLIAKDGNSPSIFQFLEQSIQKLHQVILQIRQRLEKLDLALKTKIEVFAQYPTAVSMRTDVEELRLKIGSYLSLTVTHAEEGGKSPVAGVISAAMLRKTSLGTVSLRDFCNRDEMGIPPYLEVISVIDHHKSKLQTSSPPFAFIADVQSCNTLVAFCAFEINDRYSRSEQNRETLQKAIAKLSCEGGSLSLVQRLLKKERATLRKDPFFIDPTREIVEYFHFLYAIFDDTDLLSKVSVPDVECVVELINRLKSLIARKEVEILSLDDLPRDANFPKQAAERILRHKEVYSLYRKVYLFREQEVEKQLTLSSQGKESHLFADTKEQNECCRVGQTKIFANNIPTFLRFADPIRKMWLTHAQKYHQEKREIDLHLHMISTIVNAEEVYQGKKGSYTHKDEMWIWIPEEEEAVEHLKRFLASFQDSPGLKNNPLEVEFLGDNEKLFTHIFQESFFDLPLKKIKKDLPITILRYAPGSLNSRKAMVSPFLPI
ncbi:MAG TPA: hypothetical protein VJK48_01020 [Chlamydiales bacterium]|nr:hypothetical protein [Chlamydiales bacterium]